MTTETPWAERYTPAVLRSNHRAAIDSARVVVPLLMAAFPRLVSVVDVGCGLGTFLAEFHKRGIWDILGIDGPWTYGQQLAIPATRLAPRDLRGPLDGIPAFSDGFDLCLCLEVAEHLPPESAEQLIDTLCALAPVVFFSAAVPGQGGWYHLNEQPREYWEGLFAMRGFFAKELPGLAETGDEVRPYYRAGRLFERAS